MKRFFIFALFTLGLITLISVDASAGGCRTIHRGHYVAPVVVKKAAVIHHDYGHHYYPIYNRSYLEAYDDSFQKERQQQQQINIELLKSINLLNQRIQQSQQFDPSKRAEQIGAPKGPGEPVAPPMLPADQPQSKFEQYARQRCIQCHGNGKSAGGLAMFDASGTFFTPTCKQAVKIVAELRHNRMPKNGPKPTDQEFSEAVEWQIQLVESGKLK